MAFLPPSSSAKRPRSGLVVEGLLLVGREAVIALAVGEREPVDGGHVVRLRRSPEPGERLGRGALGRAEVVAAGKVGRRDRDDGLALAGERRLFHQLARAGRILRGALAHAHHRGEQDHAVRIALGRREFQVAHGLLVLFRSVEDGTQERLRLRVAGVGRGPQLHDGLAHVAAAIGAITGGVVLGRPGPGDQPGEAGDESREAGGETHRHPVPSKRAGKPPARPASCPSGGIRLAAQPFPLELLELAIQARQADPQALRLADGLPRPHRACGRRCRPRIGEARCASPRPPPSNRCATGKRRPGRELRRDVGEGDAFPVRENARAVEDVSSSRTLPGHA